MPLLVLLAFALFAPFLFIALMPLGIVQRYRMGSARRVARGWVASINVAALSFSVVLFIGSAAITNLWVPNALSYSLAGLAGGCLLGILGLTLTRWEGEQGKLHYTPNRLLVLVITLAVAGRLVYGMWRLWHGWQLGSGSGTWLAESALPGSLAASAVVLGYSLAFWIGVRRQGRLFHSNASRFGRS